MLGIGLIGCGVMGRELASVLSKSIPEANVVACFDPYEPARERFAQDFSAASAATVDDLLARDELDAVCIASPNFLHAEHTRAAAGAGKHVFCEKPMALSVVECDAMIAAAERAGVKLMVGHSSRLMPPMRKIQQLIANGELGHPLYGQANYWFTGFKPRASGVWHIERARCGGLFYQMGIHQIDLFHAFFGPTLRVHYVGGRYGTQITDYDDIATVLLEFDSGATGSISVCGMASVESHEMNLLFSRGYIKSGGSWGALEFGTDTAHCTVLESKDFTEPGGVQVELTNFVNWILHEETPLLTSAEGRAAVAVAEAADLAKATGSVVEVG